MAERILIAGGGIGGLAAALALAQKGFDCEVLEQSSTFAEIGAGIQIGPNAFQIFRRLGIEDAINDVAFFPEFLVMRDSTTGAELTRIAVGSPAFRARYRYPYGVIYRVDLHRVLLEACRRSPRITLRAQQKLLRFRDDEKHVTVVSNDGEEHVGAALIGADGLWSKVRAELLDDGPPRVSGHIAYRAVLPISEVPAEWRPPSVVLWGGPKHHFVHYPLHRGDILNLVAVFHSNRYEEGWDTYGDPGELQQFFANAHPQVKALLGKIDAWRMWVLCDREPVANWSRGRVTLLGDAAHPMLQYLAQGAAMAMEDAYVLADEAAVAEGDFETAFVRYQQKRYKRTGRVQLTARFFGEIYHAGGATAEVRNELFFSQAPSGTPGESMAWLYDGIAP
jgi:3-hydroxybenzoate 6-monooxygenase